MTDDLRNQRQALLGHADEIERELGGGGGGGDDRPGRGVRAGWAFP